tara:strand:+ start:8259 stop:8465 length:207 start_codon:yes stop_codon:yes gene_type:complete
MIKLKDILGESRSKKVTKQMWNKMGEDERMDALLTVIKDPNDAEKFIDYKFDKLGSLGRDMYSEGKND